MHGYTDKTNKQFEERLASVIAVNGGNVKHYHQAANPLEVSPDGSHVADEY